MTVKKGDKVKVEYTGTLDDGSVFDSTEKQGKPLEFEVGSGMVIKGFEEAIVGMEKGQEKEIKLKPSEAYGDHNPKLIKTESKDKFPKDKELKPGMVLLVQLPQGPLPITITEVTDKDITVDLNHPLAGKNLNFKIKLIEILQKDPVKS